MAASILSARQARAPRYPCCFHVSPYLDNDLETLQNLDEIRALEPVSILVVEDEESIREGLIQAFTGAGHNVLEASNGAEGLELFFNEENLDIVFTDLGMSQLSGWEMIE